MVRAIDFGGFDEFLMHAHEELPEHKRSEHAEASQHNEAEMVIEQPDVAVQNKLRDQDGLARNHVGHQHDDEQPIAGGEPDFGEAVGRQSGYHGRDDCGQYADLDRVPVIEIEGIITEPYLLIILDGVPLPRNPLDRIYEYVFLHLKGCNQHPYKRKEKQNAHRKHRDRNDELAPVDADSCPHIAPSFLVVDPLLLSAH